jgi:AcrR family transcriptional regulator
MALKPKPAKTTRVLRKARTELGSELPLNKRAGPARSLSAQHANRRDRRAYIMNSAAKLFSQHGYHATTMDEVSALTKLNKGTIYYYYKSKAEILYDLCTETAEKSLTMLQPSLKMQKASDAMMHVIEVQVRWIAQHRDAVQVYFQESRYFESVFSKSQFGLIRVQQKRLTSMVYQILDLGQSSGEFRKMDVSYVGRYIIGLMMWVHRWPELEIDCGKAVKSATDLVLRGLLREPTSTR